MSILERIVSNTDEAQATEILAEQTENVSQADAIKTDEQSVSQTEVTGIKPASIGDFYRETINDDAPRSVDVDFSNHSDKKSAAQATKDNQFVRKPQNVTTSRDVFIKREHTKGGIGLSLPSDIEEAVSAAMDAAPDINLTDSPESREWASVLSEGLSYSTYNNAFVPSLEEANRDFKQGVDFNGKNYSAWAPRFKASESEKISGERAVLRMLSHLGHGSVFQIPLWHTGIWLTIKAPVDSEIVELNRLLTADKISMGRQTYGLAFSNQSSYTTDRLTQFVLDHIYDSTMKRDQIPQDGGYKSLILAQDYPTLLWGIVAARYPDGFQYSRSCTANPEKCNHVEHEFINVRELQYTDNAALTDWQIAHMSKRQSGSMDLASVKRYQEEMVRSQNQTIKFYANSPQEFTMTLKSPSIAEYVQSGHRWISDIVTLVERTVGMEAREAEREAYITKHCQATAMRQYQHWVKEVELGTNVIDDLETIEKLLNTLSADDIVRESFIQEVIDYINSSTISVVGIPVFDCPKCQGGQDDPSSPLKGIIPLDVNQVFFGLATQQLAKIESR